MFKQLKINAMVFRQAGWVLALLIAVFSFFTVCCSVSPDVELRKSSAAVSHAQLASFPGCETDKDAALRRDYNCRSNVAVRLDKGNNFRSMIPVHGNGLEVQAISNLLLPGNYKVLWHKQPLFTYYRRLWQKILPSRAGPCAWSLNSCTSRVDVFVILRLLNCPACMKIW